MPRLRPVDLQEARWDTGVGAVVTQCLTAAVLVATAAALGGGDIPASLSSVGEISSALTPIVGAETGRLIFGAGVIGASLVAAIVSSLALAWGVGEVTGYRRSLEHRPFEARWFYCVYAACVCSAAALVWFTPNLIWLAIAAQVLNAFLMPLTIGLLVVLAARALPGPVRLRGSRLWLIAGASILVSGLGLFSGVAGLI